MFILLKNIYTMYMVYTSRFSYKCRKLFPVSRNLKVAGFPKGILPVAPF